MQTKTKAVKKEISQDLPKEFVPYVKKAALEYMKNCGQEKVNGWDKFWVYARPSNRHIGTLTKITFEVGKKELNQDQLLLAIEKELSRRLLDADSYFLSGFRAYSNNEIFYQIEKDRDFILNEVLDSRSLLDALEKNVEYPEINELFQRLKDYQSNLLEHDAFIEQIHKLGKR